jgi:hypothetical protein
LILFTKAFLVEDNNSLHVTLINLQRPPDNELEESGHAHSSL